MDENYFENQKFENLKLNGEIFRDFRFIDCTFTNCTFENCKLAWSRFTDCKFQKCAVISPDSEESCIQLAEFTDCSLVGINWNSLTPKGRFSDPIRMLQNCRMKYNTFSGNAFRKFDFSGNQIVDSMFSECELPESSFQGCRLEGTEFFRCDVRKADFRDASGYQIDVMTNKLKGARFSFPEVINLLNGLGIRVD